MSLGQTCQELTVREQVCFADSPFLDRLRNLANAVQGLRARVIFCQLNEAQAVEQMDGILASLGHSTALSESSLPEELIQTLPTAAARSAPRVAEGIEGGRPGRSKKSTCRTRG